MKKNIKSYYALIMMIIYLIYNLILKSLLIGGLLYQILMIILISLNILLLIKFRKEIKYKKVIIIIYFITWLLISKNIYQSIFAITSMATLLITGFMESIFIKIITFIIALFFIVFSIPLAVALMLSFGTHLNEETRRNDIYDESHYYCENNYEVYSFSQGAMDHFHYSIGKHYEILNVNDIIHISINQRKEVSQEKFEEFVDNHKCNLVGDINGFE